MKAAGNVFFSFLACNMTKKLDFWKLTFYQELKSLVKME